MGENRHGVKRRAAAAVVAGLLLAWGCCAGFKLPLGRIADFLDGVFEISAAVSVEELVSVSFDGDLAAWADIPQLDAAEIDFEITAEAALGGELSYDVDYDAEDESVDILGVHGSTATELTLFAAWRGDKYTVDKGVCWLGWVEGDEAHVAASWCGYGSGAMYCAMGDGAASVPVCRRCLASDGSCGACDLDAKLTACLPPKPDSGSVDIDVDVDIDIDIDADVDLDADLGFDAPGGGA